MNDADRFTLLTGPAVEVAQWQARSDFQYLVARWSAGTFRLAPEAADKWWPLTNNCSTADK